MLNYVLVGLGGFAGAIFRYATSNWLVGKWPNIPLSTLLVNLLGSFILGLVLFGIAHGKSISESQRLLIAVGFCGSLTTMSSFAFDSHQLIVQNELLMLVLNIILNALGSIAMIWLAKSFF